MSTAPRYVPHYTVEDYRRWEGDWELIEGVPISMSPSPFGPHERVVSEIARQLGNEVIKNECPCRVYTNLDWIVSDDTVVRPDVMLVCGDQPERHLERAPSIVVEVLSDSTRDRDLSVKQSLYAENHVQHYIVADPQRRSIEYATSRGGEVQLEQAAESLELILDDDCRIRLDCSGVFDGEA